MSLFSFLTGYNALNALIGTRMYPRVMPQAPTLPLLTYNRISNPRIYSQSGDSGLENPRYQIDCWADDPDTAAQIAAMVVEALSGYAGPMDGDTVGASFIEDERDGYDPQTGLYRITVDARLWKEA